PRRPGPARRRVLPFVQGRDILERADPAGRRALDVALGAHRAARGAHRARRVQGRLLVPRRRHALGRRHVASARVRSGAVTATLDGRTTATLDDLTSVLGDEARHLRKLLPLLEDQERALQAADARTVRELAERQASVTAELKTLERRRQAVTSQLA